MGIFLSKPVSMAFQQFFRMLTSEPVCIMKNVSYINNFNSNSKIFNQILKCSYVHFYMCTYLRSSNVSVFGLHINIFRRWTWRSHCPEASCSPTTQRRNSCSCGQLFGLVGTQLFHLPSTSKSHWKERPWQASTGLLKIFPMKADQNAPPSLLQPRNHKGLRVELV